MSPLRIEQYLSKHAGIIPRSKIVKEKAPLDVEKRREKDRERDHRKKAEQAASAKIDSTEQIS